MTDARQTPDPDEKALLDHFRQHQSSRPPEHLDALILAIARREAPTKAPSLWQRWVRACQRPRWQVAFASLGGIALMLAVVIREPQSQSQPDQTFAPELASPAPAMMKRKAEDMPSAAGEMQAAPIVSAPQATSSESPQIRRAAPNASQERESTKARKSSAPAEERLEKGLREVLRLRQAGQADAAKAKKESLQRLFPTEDLEARLSTLKALEP